MAGVTGAHHRAIRGRIGAVGKALATPFPTYRFALLRKAPRLMHVTQRTGCAYTPLAL